jgi:hypothetical protein
LRQWSGTALRGSLMTIAVRMPASGPRKPQRHRTIHFSSGAAKPSFA